MAAENNIGYIICESESIPQPINFTPKTLNGKVIAEGILQTADERNRNGRYYAKEELFPQITCPRTQELLSKGYLRAEKGHPLSKDLARQSTIDDTRTCARFLKLWTEGNDVWGQFVATNNTNGKAFDMDLREGCLPAWSLRALGSVEQTPRGAEVKNLRVITWDQVIYPSHPRAYTQRVLQDGIQNNLAVPASQVAPADESTQIVSESASIAIPDHPLEEASLTPLFNDDLVNFIMEESSNLKFVQECMDFTYDHLQVTPNGSRVILNTKDGNILGINLESFIHRELMDYVDKYSHTED